MLTAGQIIQHNLETNSGHAANYSTTECTVTSQVLVTEWKK